MNDRCTATNSAGLPCIQFPMKGTVLCVSHTPGHSQTEANARKRIAFLDLRIDRLTKELNKAYQERNALRDRIDVRND